MTLKTNIGTITASKETLNIICSICQESAESYKKSGRNALAKRTYNISEEIFKALTDAGYYNFD